MESPPVNFHGTSDTVSVQRTLVLRNDLVAAREEESRRRAASASELERTRQDLVSCAGRQMEALGDIRMREILGEFSA
jgi:hypothetical protein